VLRVPWSHSCLAERAGDAADAAGQCLTAGVCSSAVSLMPCQGGFAHPDPPRNEDVTLSVGGGVLF